MSVNITCIICLSASNNNSANHYIATSSTYYSCERCGAYGVNPNLQAVIGDLSENLRPALSKTVRTIANGLKKGDKKYEITKETIANLAYISPFEQAENLILLIGKRQESIGKHVHIGTSDQARHEVFALIGISVNKSEQDLNFLCKHLMTEGFINSPDLMENRGSIKGGVFNRIQLTFKGWEKHAELKRSIEDSKIVFMAMKFPENGLTPPYQELEKVYKIFQEKVKETGFTLTNPLLDRPEGGSIDNRLAVEIRKAKFIVADLSHDNQGVYWEAGFANGLGKKVFYTCKKDDLIKTHFDISHHTTIFWEVGKEEEAANKLRDTIRNTFPEEAIQ